MTVRIIKKGNTIHEEKVVPSVSKKKLTIRQQKVVELVGKGLHSKGAILRRAGYPESIARKPSKVFDSDKLQEAINPVIKKMSAVRDKALNALQKKDFGKQSPYNLTIITSTMTKDVELLSGRPTDRTHHELSQEEKDRLNKLFKKNQAK